MKAPPPRKKKLQHFESFSIYVFIVLQVGLITILWFKWSVKKHHFLTYMLTSEFNFTTYDDTAINNEGREEF